VRKAEDVHVTYDPLPFRHGWLVFHKGKERFRVRQIEKSEFRSIFRWAMEAPQRIGRADRDVCWLYKDRYFWVSIDLGEDATRSALRSSGIH
jgi:hypothetical protein